MIAVFYDVENLESLQNCENAINEVKRIIQDQPSLQYAHAEWGRLSEEYRHLFIKCGIMQKQVINGVGYYNNIKNAVDIALAIDAMELVARNLTVNHIILVSGDGGYISLVNKLREYGKTITIVSLDDRLNNSLVHFASNIYTVKKVDRPSNYENITLKSGNPNNTEGIIVLRDKTVWALAKTNGNLDSFCKEVIDNQIILDSLFIEAVSIYFLTKSFLKAKGVLGSAVFNDEYNKAMMYFERYKHDKVAILDGKIYLKDQVIGEDGVESSGKNIDSVIKTYIQDKDIYKSFTIEEQVDLIGKKTRADREFIKNILIKINTLPEEALLKLNNKNYHEILIPHFKEN